MANQHTFSVDIGAYIGSTIRPVAYLPSGAGGVTLTSVKIHGMAAGTAIGLILASATNVGTPAVAGTHAAFGGTIVFAEGVVFDATISTPWVAEGQWLAIDQASGTAPANTLLSISYIDGK